MKTKEELIETTRQHIQEFKTTDQTKTGLKNLLSMEILFNFGVLENDAPEDIQQFVRDLGIRW